MNEPSWLIVARRYIGVAEIPGKDENPVIVKWLLKLKAAWNSETVPWCGTFVGVCFSEVGIPLAKHWYRARDWLNWGVTLLVPTAGCVVIYERTGGGHVGFVVGRDQNDNLMTLGGNQGDAVNIKPFPRSRVLGYRWPSGEVVSLSPLPVVGSDGQLSTGEA